MEKITWPGKHTSHVEKILKNLLGSKEVGDGVSGEVDLSDSVSHVGEFVIDDVINEFSDVYDKRVVTGDRGLLVFVVVEHLKMLHVIKR